MKYETELRFKMDKFGKNKLNYLFFQKQKNYLLK